jgi:ribose transport system substrate-binding protein
MKDSGREGGMRRFAPDLQPGPRKSPRYYVKVLGKALRVLDYLHHNRQGLPLKDIAEAAQLDMATVLRILYTLQRDGWVSRDPHTKKYNLLLGYRTFRIGYAQLCSEDPFSQAVTRGLAVEAKKHFIDFLIADNKLDAETAVENAEWMIEHHVDFAIEFQIHHRVAPVLAEMFRKARIPTLAIDIPQPGAIYFGPNNYAAGQLAGETLGRFAFNNRKWRPRRIRVLLLETYAAGPLPHSKMLGTARGIRTALGTHVGVHLEVLHRDAKDTEIGGYAAATKLLRELHPREHLLIGTMNDAIALGALRAVREAGRERLTAIVSQDFSPDPRVSAAIRDPDSPFAGSVAFFPERYGSKIIPAVLRWLNKEQVPPSFYTDHAMVTADNVERFCSVNDSQPAG